MGKQTSSGPRPKPIPITALPTCRQLGEQLVALGDIPLFSGRTMWGITSFGLRKDGVASTRAVEVYPFGDDWRDGDDRSI